MVIRMHQGENHPNQNPTHYWAYRFNYHITLDVLGIGAGVFVAFVRECSNLGTFLSVCVVRLKFNFDFLCAPYGFLVRVV